VVIGTLARLGVDKRLEQLIDAVAHACAHGLFDSCELRIAGGVELGDDAYVAALRERARDLPITWVGEQDSATFLAQLDLFAMISEPSGCPNASIEAMAAGLAVVATDVGGARDQIIHGETGLLVPRGDSHALAEAVAELARDPGRRAAMGRASHVRALERFDVRRMANDYARICLGITLSSPYGAAAAASVRHEPGTRVQVTTTSV
jgi:glycosyltransferase involved in cell wall biosynthesis